MTKRDGCGILYKRSGERGVEREAEARTERAAKKAEVHERDESKNF